PIGYPGAEVAPERQLPLRDAVGVDLVRPVDDHRRRAELQELRPQRLDLGRVEALALGQQVSEALGPAAVDRSGAWRGDAASTTGLVQDVAFHRRRGDL